jgi:hypothetical protein
MQARRARRAESSTEGHATYHGWFSRPKGSASEGAPVAGLRGRRGKKGRLLRFYRSLCAAHVKFSGDAESASRARRAASRTLGASPALGSEEPFAGRTAAINRRQTSVRFPEATRRASALTLLRSQRRRVAAAFEEVRRQCAGGSATATQRGIDGERGSHMRGQLSQQATDSPKEFIRPPTSRAARV